MLTFCCYRRGERIFCGFETIQITWNWKQVSNCCYWAAARENKPSVAISKSAGVKQCVFVCGRKLLNSTKKWKTNCWTTNINGGLRHRCITIKFTQGVVDLESQKFSWNLTQDDEKMVKLTATANEHHITTKNFVKVSKGFTYYKRVDFTKYFFSEIRENFSFIQRVSVAQCGNYWKSLSQQKFRESNVFTKEVTKELISRNIFSVR